MFLVCGAAAGTIIVFCLLFVISRVVNNLCSIMASNSSTSKHRKSDSNASFLRAAKTGKLEKIVEYLNAGNDINTTNANGLNALHFAAKENHVEIVEELLKRGMDVDSTTKKKNTVLHIASLAGKDELVKLLVKRGATVNVQNQKGFTPLYMAAQNNFENLVKFLLANEADQNLGTVEGYVPLDIAVQQGHDKVVDVLLQSDSHGKVRLPALHIAAKKDNVKAASLLLLNDYNPDVTSKSGFTPLHIAAHYGNENIANVLLDKNADINFHAKHNITPLHVSAKWGKLNMVELLVKRGAALDGNTRDGLTPLHCAARSGHDQVVDVLLEKGAPITAKTKNGLAPLHMAAQGDHVDTARILLYHKAPVDDVTIDYLTALHVAAHCGHVRVAKLLLDRKADPNSRALNGFTPLHIACKKNRIKVVELLLKHGASIEATTESGLTPLHVASFMGCMNIVIYLITHGSNCDVPTVRGESALHLAARANQTDIIRILLRNGADVDSRAREGQTPLHVAARLGNVDIVVLLLQHGALVDATTKDMYTALHIAAKEGQEEVASVLLEHSASLTATTKKGFTPLHLAAKYGNIKVARLLLNKDAPVDAQGKNGVTPLHVAAHYDNVDVALLLLEKGASPHSSAKNGYTPLHIASKKNQMDIATSLLEYGAKPNAESKAGFAPLHLAAQEGHTDVTSLLMEHKADTDQKAKNGLTPMHLCAQEDRVPAATILVEAESDIAPQTNAGYTPLHVACHFGQINMVRYLLQHGAYVNTTTSHGYTPLHQAAQQGHTLIINLLLEHRASPNAVTNQGQTALSIAQKLGYISVVETLKVVTETIVTTTTTTVTEEKYRVVAPETMQETFMSDSEDEGGEDAMLGDQAYHYLTSDEMKSLGDDSMPIDVTNEDKLEPIIIQRESNIATFAAPPGTAETDQSPVRYPSQEAIFTATNYTPDNIDISRTPVYAGKLQWKTFLVSFMVDARGGAMRGCRHSGIRVIIPPRKAPMPMRITCRYLKKDRLAHPPPLMEGEAVASRVLEMGPNGAKFLGPVIIEVPHFASLRGKEREIVILRSDNGETWREHTLEASEEAIQEVLNESFEGDELTALEDLNTSRITRILTTDFPQYFAVVTRVRQEVHAIGPEGGMVSSTVVPQVQAVFQEGALTKKIKVGLQAQPIPSELVAKMLGNRVAVSPIVTVEPRRRKFHKPITLTIPVPQAAAKGMINQYSGDTPTLRLLCSITGGVSKAQWEDVTGSTPLTFVNDCVSFTTTVSARFWLMDCRQVHEATKYATDLYKEAIHIPFMAKFVVFAKRHDPMEARLSVFCMTDDKEDKTLEHQEHFTEVAKSRDVEVQEGKSQFLEFAGNLVPVTKSGEQLSLTFNAFKENRLPFIIRVKDSNLDPMGRVAFMREPKVSRGDAPQQPMCNLNIALPDVVPDAPRSEVDLVTLERKYTYMTEPSSFMRTEQICKADLRLPDIANAVGNDWSLLALQLDVPESDISTIKSNCPDDTSTQALVMLRLWVQQSGNKANGNVLQKALIRINREDIVNNCIYNRVLVTDDLEKAVAKVQLDQSGFDAFKEELGSSRDASMKREMSLEVSYDEQDMMREAESADESSSDGAPKDEEVPATDDEGHPVEEYPDEQDMLPDEIPIGEQDHSKPDVVSHEEPGMEKPVDDDSGTVTTVTHTETFGDSQLPDVIGREPQTESQTEGSCCTKPPDGSRYDMNDEDLMKSLTNPGNLSREDFNSHTTSSRINMIHEVCYRRRSFESNSLERRRRRRERKDQGMSPIFIFPDWCASPPTCIDECLSPIKIVIPRTKIIRVPTTEDRSCSPINFYELKKHNLRCRGEAKKTFQQSSTDSECDDRQNAESLQKSTRKYIKRKSENNSAATNIVLDRKTFDTDHGVIVSESSANLKCKAGTSIEVSYSTNTNIKVTVADNGELSTKKSVESKSKDSNVEEGSPVWYRHSVSKRMQRPQSLGPVKFSDFGDNYLFDREKLCNIENQADIKTGYDNGHAEVAAGGKARGSSDIEIDEDDNVIVPVRNKDIIQIENKSVAEAVVAEETTEIKGADEDSIPICIGEVANVAEEAVPDIRDAVSHTKEIIGKIKYVGNMEITTNERLSTRDDGSEFPLNAGFIPSCGGRAVTSAYAVDDQEKIAAAVEVSDGKDGVFVVSEEETATADDEATDSENAFPSDVEEQAVTDGVETEIAEAGKPDFQEVMQDAEEAKKMAEEEVTDDKDEMFVIEQEKTNAEKVVDQKDTILSAADKEVTTGEVEKRTTVAVVTDFKDDTVPTAKGQQIEDEIADGEDEILKGEGRAESADVETREGRSLDADETIVTTEVEEGVAKPKVTDFRGETPLTAEELSVGDTEVADSKDERLLIAQEGIGEQITYGKDEIALEDEEATIADEGVAVFKDPIQQDVEGRKGAAELEETYFRSEQGITEVEVTDTSDQMFDGEEEKTESEEITDRKDTILLVSDEEMLTGEEQKGTTATEVTDFKDGSLLRAQDQGIIQEITDRQFKVHLVGEERTESVDEETTDSANRNQEDVDEEVLAADVEVVATKTEVADFKGEILQDAEGEKKIVEEVIDFKNDILSVADEEVTAVEAEGRITNSEESGFKEEIPLILQEDKDITNGVTYGKDEILLKNEEMASTDVEATDSTFPSDVDEQIVTTVLENEAAEPEEVKGEVLLDVEDVTEKEGIDSKDDEEKSIGVIADRKDIVASITDEYVTDATGFKDESLLIAEDQGISEEVTDRNDKALMKCEERTESAADSKSTFIFDVDEETVTTEEEKEAPEPEEVDFSGEVLGKGIDVKVTDGKDEMLLKGEERAESVNEEIESKSGSYLDVEEEVTDDKGITFDKEAKANVEEISNGKDTIMSGADEEVTTVEAEQRTAGAEVFDFKDESLLIDQDQGIAAEESQKKDEVLLKGEETVDSESEDHLDVGEKIVTTEVEMRAAETEEPDLQDEVPLDVADKEVTDSIVKMFDDKEENSDTGERTDPKDTILLVSDEEVPTGDQRKQMAVTEVTDFEDESLLIAQEDKGIGDQVTYEKDKIMLKDEESATRSKEEEVADSKNSILQNFKEMVITEVVKGAADPEESDGRGKILLDSEEENEVADEEAFTSLPLLSPGEPETVPDAADEEDADSKSAANMLDIDEEKAITSGKFDFKDEVLVDVEGERIIAEEEVSDAKDEMSDGEEENAISEEVTDRKDTLLLVSDEDVPTGKEQTPTAVTEATDYQDESLTLQEDEGIGDLVAYEKDVLLLKGEEAATVKKVGKEASEPEETNGRGELLLAAEGGKKIAEDVTDTEDAKLVEKETADQEIIVRKGEILSVSDEDVTTVEAEKRTGDVEVTVKDERLLIDKKDLGIVEEIIDSNCKVPMQYEEQAESSYEETTDSKSDLVFDADEQIATIEVEKEESEPEEIDFRDIILFDNGIGEKATDGKDEMLLQSGEAATADHAATDSKNTFPVDVDEQIITTEVEKEAVEPEETDCRGNSLLDADEEATDQKDEILSVADEVAITVETKDESLLTAQDQETGGKDGIFLKKEDETSTFDDDVTNSKIPFALDVDGVTDTEDKMIHCEEEKATADEEVSDSEDKILLDGDEAITNRKDEVLSAADEEVTTVEDEEMVTTELVNETVKEETDYKGEIPQGSEGEKIAEEELTDTKEKTLHAEEETATADEEMTDRNDKIMTLTNEGVTPVEVEQIVTAEVETKLVEEETDYTGEIPQGKEREKVTENGLFRGEEEIVTTDEEVGAFDSLLPTDVGKGIITTEVENIAAEPEETYFRSEILLDAKGKKKSAEEEIDAKDKILGDDEENTITEEVTDLKDTVLSGVDEEATVGGKQTAVTDFEDARLVTVQEVKAIGEQLDYGKDKIILKDEETATVDEEVADSEILVLEDVDEEIVTSEVEEEAAESEDTGGRGKILVDAEEGEEIAEGVSNTKVTMFLDCQEEEKVATDTEIIDRRDGVISVGVEEVTTVEAEQQTAASEENGIKDESLPITHEHQGIGEEVTYGMDEISLKDDETATAGEEVVDSESLILQHFGAEMVTTRLEKGAIEPEETDGRGETVLNIEEEKKLVEEGEIGGKMLKSGEPGTSSADEVVDSKETNLIDVDEQKISTDREATDSEITFLIDVDEEMVTAEVQKGVTEPKETVGRSEIMLVTGGEIQSTEVETAVEEEVTDNKAKIRSYTEKEAISDEATPDAESMVYFDSIVKTTEAETAAADEEAPYREDNIIAEEAATVDKLVIDLTDGILKTIVDYGLTDSKDVVQVDAESEVANASEVVDSKSETLFEIEDGTVANEEGKTSDSEVMLDGEEKTVSHDTLFDFKDKPVLTAEEKTTSTEVENVFADEVETTLGEVMIKGEISTADGGTEIADEVTATTEEVTDDKCRLLLDTEEQMVFAGKVQTDSRDEMLLDAEDGIVADDRESEIVGEEITDGIMLDEEVEVTADEVTDFKDIHDEKLESTSQEEKVVANEEIRDDVEITEQEKNDTEDGAIEDRSCFGRINKREAEEGTIKSGVFGGGDQKLSGVKPKETPTSDAACTESPDAAWEEPHNDDCVVKELLQEIVSRCETGLKLGYESDDNVVSSEHSQSDGNDQKISSRPHAFSLSLPSAVASVYPKLTRASSLANVSKPDRYSVVDEKGCFLSAGSESEAPSDSYDSTLDDTDDWETISSQTVCSSDVSETYYRHPLSESQLDETIFVDEFCPSFEVEFTKPDEGNCQIPKLPCKLGRIRRYMYFYMFCN
ncbi:Uncharacterised protein g682 [Pycnogonum litorale]